MSIHGGRSFGRGVVAVCAAGALLVSLLASPASAVDAPNDTSIKGLLKGGQIILDPNGSEPTVFPLGEKDGSSVKDKTENSVCDSELEPKKEKEPRSHFTADVDGTGKASNFGFHFAQGVTGEKFTDFNGDLHEVCAKLEVKNTVQGQLTDKQVALDPGPAVRANFVIKRKDGEDRGQVRWTCTTNIDADNHAGKFSDPKDSGEKPQHDWDLNHAPKVQKFQVPAVQATAQCPSLVASLVNNGLGLPTVGHAEFKWWVYDCSTTTCSTLHPNKS